MTYIILAPMQGYADFIMRQILSEIGGFDEVVSEFVRITHTLHSLKTWQKKVPELKMGAKTLSGVPCAVQLLGSDAENMAENARVAVLAGAKKIDLNFGCPAPTVNKHSGGAALLDSPNQIYHIVSTIKNRLPENIPLTAKIRLGLSETSKTIDCANAIKDGGAAALTVHARTKDEQYNPPAHWEWFAIIQEQVKIPLIANGDIFSPDDYQRLLKICTPDGIMLGRGVLRNPFLALQIKGLIDDIENTQIIAILNRFIALCQESKANETYTTARLKQWLNLLQQAYPPFALLLNQIKKEKKIENIKNALSSFQAT